MIKLLDDIYTWSVFSEEKQLNFNGWFIQNQSSSFGNVVIDPPQPSEKDLVQMQNFGGVQQIIITNQHHIRKASIIRDKFNSKLQINSLDAAKIDIPIKLPVKQLYIGRIGNSFLWEMHSLETRRENYGFSLRKCMPMFNIPEMELRHCWI